MAPVVYIKTPAGEEVERVSDTFHPTSTTVVAAPDTDPTILLAAIDVTALPVDSLRI